MRKTAEERAAEFLNRWGVIPLAALGDLTALFKAHAKDQRHICAGAVLTSFGDVAHARALHAPEPGA